MENDVTAAMASLDARITELEAAAEATRRFAPPGRQVLDVLSQGDDRASLEHGHVMYSGTGPWNGSTVAWQMQRGWDDVIAAAGESAARVLSSLASAARLRIVTELVSGSVSTGDLASRLDQPSSGQLFHHLKELLAAGIIHQPQRGVYALRPQHVLPILAVLSAAADLGTPSEVEPV